MADPQNDTTQAETFATRQNALPLSELALIGTMGTDAARRALVRFPGGRIEQVRVGDTLRGNRIDAIEPERLLMSRAGRQSVLDMPQG